MAYPGMTIDMDLVRRMIAAGNKDELIADVFGCHPNTIRNHRRKHGIQRRGGYRKKTESRGWNWNTPILEGPLPANWIAAVFADVEPAKLEAETHWTGWWRLPSREAFTHRGSSAAFA